MKTALQILAIGCIGLVVAVVYFTFVCAGPGCVFFSMASLSKATDYASCVRSGFPDIPTTPHRCRAGMRLFWGGSGSLLHVFVPEQGSTVGLPLRIAGEVQASSGNLLRIFLQDDVNTPLTEVLRTAPSSGSGRWAPFQESLSYGMPNSTGGTLVLTLESKRRKILDTARIPVHFSSERSEDVKVYFGNSERNPGEVFCDVAYPVVRRLPMNVDPLRAALLELLLGPTELERRQGFFSSILPKTKLASLSVRGPRVAVRFESPLGAGTGATCREQEKRSQVERTIRQFPNISTVQW